MGVVRQQAGAGRLPLPGRALPGGAGWGDGLVLVTYVIWSANVVVTKLAVGPVGPLTFSALRWVLGAGLLAALARWREGPLRWPRGRELAQLTLAAGCGVVINQVSFTWALRLTSADNVSLLAGTAPLGVAGWLAWRRRQRLSTRVWAGLGVGLAGLGLVVLTGAHGRSSVAGDLVGLGLPVSWTAYLLLISPLLSRHPPLALAAMVSLVGSIGLAPLGIVEAVVAPARFDSGVLGLLAFSALAAVTLSGWLYYTGLERLGPTRTSVYGYTQPFLGIVFAAALIGEPIRPLQLVGGVAITLGVLAGRPPAVRVPVLRGGAPAPSP